jgi:AsmA family
MKKKLLYAGGIIAALIVIVIVGLTIFVKSYLRSDRLKAIIIPKIEEFTGRKASIGNIDVSLFKGIDVEGISLMDRDEKSEFLKVREFVLNYSLLPLLHKQLVIKKVEVVSPSVALVREKDGTYNFSDILEKAKARKKETKPSAEEEGLPFSVVTDKITVRDASMTFSDEQGAIPTVSLVSDIDLKVAVEKGAAPEISGKMDVKALTMKVGENEIKSAGTIGIDKDAIAFDLSSTVGKDTIHLSGDVKDYRNAPVGRLDASAKELDLDKLLALSGGKGGTAAVQKKDRTASAQAEKTQAGKSAGVSASGEIRIASAKYQDYLLKDFAARYSYAKDSVTINPVSTGISGGSGAQIAGTIKADLRFSLASGGSASESIKRSLSGNASVDLSRCEVKKTKITDAIALFTGIREIATPRFDKVNFLFTIGNQKVDLKGLMSSALLNLDPTGTVGFDKRIDVMTDLKVAPSLSGGLTPSAIATYVKDEKGWTVIPLKITGTTDKPSVGLNKAKVIKGVEKGIKQEIRKGLFKGLFGK